MDLSEKIDKLEFETSKLETKIISSATYTSYFFLAALLIPFLTYIVLYNLSCMKDDQNEVDRKKVMRYTILVVIIIWIILYGINWYLYKYNQL